METKELLLQLTKKLESGELKLLVGERKDHFNIHLDDNEQGDSIKLAVIKKLQPSSNTIQTETHYEASWNDEFKEKFYKERGVKCWVANCQNKILEKVGDHKKVKVPCSEKHTRMVCIECSKKYE